MKYIKKYYKPIIAFIIILILGFSLLSRTTIKTDGYSVDNVYNTIKELSSDKYNGREIGTPGNMAAAQYIEGQFKELGLEPAGDYGTYRKEYLGYARVYDGIPILEVVDKEGKVVKQYSYGQDFIEQSYGYSIPGEATSGVNIVDFSKSSVEKADDRQDIAVVTPEIPQYTSKADYLKYLSVSLVKADYKGLITVTPDDTDFSVLSGDIGNKIVERTGYEMPTLIVKSSIADALKNYTGAGDRIHMKSTFDVKSGAAADIIGMIPGSGKGYLYITSHLDGLGRSADGKLYPGALDDASGVGAMLEIARYIKSQGKKPEQNIVFIAFNGEERGLTGSHKYVHDLTYPPYEITGVINLDMVGANEDVPLTIMYSSVLSTWVNETMDPSAKLRDHLKNVAERMGIQVNELDSQNSDHFWFESAAIPAVTLIDYDDSKIHTPGDDMSNINKENINRALSLVINYVSISAFSNLTAHGYNMALGDAAGFIMDMYPLLLVLLLVAVLGYMEYRKRRKDPKARVRSFPVLGLISMVALIGIVTYFPLRYQSAPAQSTEALLFIGQGFVNILVSMLTIFLFCLFAAPSFIVLFAARRKIMRWDYEGDGKIFDIAYYISMVIFVACSYYFTTIYSTTGHLAFTPDFARYTLGKIAVYAVVGFISYMVCRFFYFETGGKHRSMAGMLAFSIIFFVLISCFYTPITNNKFVKDLTYRSVNVTDYSAFD